MKRPVNKFGVNLIACFETASREPAATNEICFQRGKRTDTSQCIFHKSSHLVYIYGIPCNQKRKMCRL